MVCVNSKHPHIMVIGKMPACTIVSRGETGCFPLSWGKVCEEPGSFSDNMMKFVHLFLALPAMAKASGNVLHDESIDFSVLGTNDLSEIEYEMVFEVDESCHYTLQTSFKHQPEFLVGTAETCKPGVNDPYDGRPTLEGRWRWERLPLYIREAAGIDHVSIDYNPCGHPGPGFLEPHYDGHFYTVSPEYRAFQMVCDQNVGAPTCATQQDTTEGKGFFHVAKSILSDEYANMPPNFSILESDAVIHMGLHSLDFSKMPNVTGSWYDPVYIICTHDSKVVAVEPMFPYTYVSGDEDRFHGEDLIYVEQSISTLPHYYSVEYKASTGRTNLVLKGLSNVCSQDELDRLREEENGVEAEGVDSASSFEVALSGLSLLLVAGLLLGS